jgi:hypothetical protein
MTEHNAMKAYRGDGGKHPHILNVGTREGSVFSFDPWEIARSTHWIRGWIGPRVG